MSKLYGWTDYLEALKSAAKIIDSTTAPDDPLMRMEACRFLMLAMSQGYIVRMLYDNDFPHFNPIFHWPFAIGANPDATYYHTSVDPNGVYRIWGNRNSIYLVNLQLTGEYFGIDGGSYAGLTNYDFRDLTVAADGSFEFILSPQKPAEWHGDWRKMLPETRYLLLRQFSYDWLNEKEAEVRIERIDRKIDYPPRQTAEQLEHALKDSAKINVGVAQFWGSHVSRLRNQRATNELFTEGLIELGGWSAQLYFHCAYQIELDEALVLETEIPRKCRYWNVQLTDEFYIPIDYVNRQTYTNGFRAHIDTDGKFRAVISNTDPGIENWLDTNGYTTGSILWRWNECNNPPTPKLTKVKLRDLGDHIRNDTPRLSAKERASMVNKFRNAYLWRTHR